ncbi:NADPH-dependent FMN reductase [Paucidesulfovibrio gracilis DSM 16080]|uniref:NADPH-dependent FMN reductase n=1 Tax=Paucidesulfovibrio gracilis DSM 16080 TaxID=1121449 RepID=A0A1T4X7A9_9BACT|nr:flavodoxin family protein [Paucidesulfovibrio gracilis]SKA85329.1 NADPH-dependent FMN reductase [Paucidesulfovibrio gracilis DSM 16080]
MTPSDRTEADSCVSGLTPVLGCSGSPRKGGNSDLLLRAALDGAAQGGAAGFAAHLPDYRFDPCVGCEQCRTAKACTRLQDGMQLLYPRVQAAHGLILACPTHNYNVTAWMKAFIDRLYCFYDFDMQARPRTWGSRLAGQGRVAVVMAVCEQESSDDMGVTLEAMTRPLQALGYEVLDQLAVLRIFDKAGVRDDRESLERAHALGQILGQRVASLVDGQ